PRKKAGKDNDECAGKQGRIGHSLAVRAISGFGRRCGHQPQLDSSQSCDLVAQTRCLLEFEVARVLEHLLLEFLDSFRSLLWSELRVLAALLLDLRRPTSVAVGVCALHDVGYALLDTARRDPVFL